MNMFIVVVLTGTMLVAPANAQTFVRFHSGVNLSVAPGGADYSSEPLAVQQAANAQRVSEAVDIGFDFEHVHLSLAPQLGRCRILWCPTRQCRWRFARDSSLEGDGFELVWGFFLSSGCFELC